MEAVDVVAALVILVGLVGVLVPVLPGTSLIGLTLVGWALAEDTRTAWVAAAIGVAVLVLGTVVKYAVPHRRLRRHGVPGRTLLAGGLLGIVGFFVIPVVGLPVGFVAGVYLAELARLGRPEAWPSTKAAMAAVGLSLAIELTAALLATGTFVVGVAAT